MKHFVPYAVAATVAAAALVVEGAVVLIGGPVPDDHWGTRGTVVDAAFVVALLGMVLATAGLPGLLGLRRTGRVAVIAAQIGFSAMAVESVVSGIHGGNTLGALFLGGVLLALLANLTLGIDGLLARRRRWAALLPALGMIVGIAGGDQGGSILWGLAWILTAAALLRTRPTVDAVAA